MLRLAVLVLLLANAAYYGWSSGLLAPWGFAPQVEGEPERLRQQIAPESLQIVAPDQARDAAPRPQPAPAPVSPEPPVPSAPPAQTPASNGASATLGDPRPQAGVCLQAGPMNEARAVAVRGALAALPSGSWTMEASELAGRWMVYMGRFPDEETTAKKRAELRALKVAFDRPGSALEPGLSLGRFATEEAAQRGLADLIAHGVRTARVVQERAPETRQLLRLPAATNEMRAQLAGLAIAWGDTPLQPCGK